MLKDHCIRFDWAIKRLLRQKANFGVLEGFLTVFLNEKVENSRDFGKRREPRGCR